MTSPLVTVITPCYNGEVHLIPYFFGLLSQTYEQIELVFVDDGSIDGTVELFEKWRPRLQGKFEGGVKLICQENQGPCGAMNAGFKEATGEFIVPCDSDDILLPRAIESHVACFIENPDCGLVYSNCHYRISEDDLPSFGSDMPGMQKNMTDLEGDLKSCGAKIQKKWTKSPEGHDVYETVLRGGMLAVAGAYAFRRECLDHIPGRQLRESYPGQNLPLFLWLSCHEAVTFHDYPAVCLLLREGSQSRQKSLEGMRKLSVDSKAIVLDAIQGLGCSAETRVTVEQRYLSRELRYHFAAGNMAELRSCFSKAFKLGMFNRKWLIHFICHFSPRSWRWLSNRKYSAYLS